MQTLSATLASAQARMDVSPVVSVVVGDLPPETPRLSGLVSQYAGTEPDSAFDASWTNDGKIVRVRLTGGILYGQVVDPAVPTWSTWTTIDAAAGNWAGTNQCACLGRSDGVGWAGVFYVASDGHTIKWSYYTPAGGWAAGTVTYDRGAGFLVSGLATDANDPTIRLYFVVSGAELDELHWTGTTWSVPVSDGRVWGSPTLAASFRPVGAPSGDGDAWCVVANGSPTSLSVEQFKITSGSGWAGSPTTLLTAGAGSGYSYAYPHFSEARSDSPRCALTWSEVAPAPIGTAPVICFTPNHLRVTGVLPWRYGGAFGAKVFRDTFVAPSWWVVTSNSVYKVAADTGSATQRVAFDQSQVVQVEVSLPGPNKAGAGLVTLLNLAGVLADAGVVGSPHQALRQWSQVAISVGYRTAAGVETIVQPPLWVESITFHDETKSGTPLVTLRLIDGWGILERLRYRSTVTYLAQTPEWLLDGALWHVCGVLSGTGNARLGAFTLATFTVRAGEVLATVVRRLLELGSVTLVFRSRAVGDGIGPASVGCVGVSRASSGSVYSYGAAGQHSYLRVEVDPLVAPGATSVEVAGLSTVSLARNWGQSWLLWRDIQSRVVDKTLATQAATDAVASNLGQTYTPGYFGGFVEVLANVGQELEDQVALSVATAPVAAAVATVLGIRLAYAQADGRLIQRLDLVGTN